MNRRPSAPILAGAYPTGSGISRARRSRRFSRPGYGFGVTSSTAAEGRCRFCRCTDKHPCLGGCGWLNWHTASARSATACTTPGSGSPLIQKTPRMTDAFFARFATAARDPRDPDEHNPYAPGDSGIADLPLVRQTASRKADRPRNGVGRPITTRAFTARTMTHPRDSCGLRRVRSRRRGRIIPPHGYRDARCCRLAGAGCGVLRLCAEVADRHVEEERSRQPETSRFPA
jgi:hypothetical protein